MSLSRVAPTLKNMEKKQLFTFSLITHILITHATTSLHLSSSNHTTAPLILLRALFINHGTVMSEAKEGNLQPSAQLKYQQWLRSKHVKVSNLVSTTNDTNLVVAGWGCVATSDIEQGAVLFSIPREACFGAAATDDENEEDDDPTTRDTQMDLAISILQSQKQQCLDNNNNDGSNKEAWSPFLSLLTPPPHGLPWTWEPEFRQAMLQGTELERVVENKVKRMSMEYEQIMKTKEQHGLSSITYQEYVNACAIVAR